MRLWLPVLLTTGIALGVPSQAQKQPLSLSPGQPRQGEALFLRLEEPGAERPEVRWSNRLYPLLKSGDAWTVSLPISPDTPAGSRPLVLTYSLGGETRELRRSVPVARTAYAVQRLRMARSTAALYNYPGVEKEERLVSGAIRTRSEERLWSGDWTIPLWARLSTPFGVRRLRNGRAVGRHRGLDLAAPEGTPIRAPAAGRVVLARKLRKHGGTIVLDHGMGITSLYLHQSALKVKEGQSVARGERIGSVGSTGVATGPHLHWSVYVQGTPVEPGFFLRLSKRGAIP